MEENKMEFSKVVSTAMKISHLTQLNIYVIDDKGEVGYHDEKISIPSFMPGAGMQDAIDFFHKIENGSELYSYINSWGLYYLGYSFLEQEALYFVVIGPYLEVIPNIYSLSLQYNLNSHQNTDLKDFIEKINVLTEGQISSYAAVLQQFDSMKEKEAYPSVIYPIENKAKRAQENAIVDEEANLVERRYKIERDFMHAVENGDKKAALKQISSDNMLFSFSERFPNQPLRRLKNLTIILNTLLRIASGNGDVPAILIHRISEKFAYEIENGGNIAELHQIQDHMIEEYCDLVKSNSLKNYSYMIRKVMEHIMSYYDQKINMTDLAQLSHTHPGNLSRRFKKESGLTITEYQQNLRIGQAKHLLKEESLSIDEVAWMVGYDDPSYFGKVFKKITGC